MTDAPAIRAATRADAAAIAEIYNWYVAHTVITFEVDPVSADEMARRIEAVLAAHEWLPLLRTCEGARVSAAERAGRIEAVLAAHEWLVLDRKGEVLGYAYAGRFRERAAY